jgi:hypothetical protein
MLVIVVSIIYFLVPASQVVIKGVIQEDTVWLWVSLFQNFD